MSNRKPNYDTALQIIQLAMRAFPRRTPWPLAEAAEEIGCSARTIKRYVEALADVFQDDEGRPLLTIEHEGNRNPRLVVSRPVLALNPWVYDYASLFLAMQMLNFAEGTELQAGLARIEQGLAPLLPAEAQSALRRMARKFHVFHHGARSIPDGDVFSDVFSAVVQERRLRIQYEGWKAPAVLEPLSLIVFKEGLYLVTRAPKNQKLYVLAVERIRRADFLTERFAYPDDWSPEQFRGQNFGMLPGEVMDVSLRFRPHLYEYLRSRTFHPTQKLKKLRDGSVRMTMSVSGLEELRAWICAFGDEVVVEGPEKLRRSVAARLQGAAEQYR